MSGVLLHIYPCQIEMGKEDLQQKGFVVFQDIVQILVHWIKTSLSISWIQNHFECF